MFHACGNHPDRYSIPSVGLIFPFTAALLWVWQRACGLCISSFRQPPLPLLGVPIALLPAFFISDDRHDRGDGVSLLRRIDFDLLAVNAIVHWSTAESLLAIGMLFLFYLVPVYPGISAGIWGYSSTISIFWFYQHYRRRGQLSLQPTPFSRVRSYASN